VGVAVIGEKGDGKFMTKTRVQTGTKIQGRFFRNGFAVPASGSISRER
jgi:hypothetical protein